MWIAQVVYSENNIVDSMWPIFTLGNSNKIQDTGLKLVRLQVLNLN